MNKELLAKLQSSQDGVTTAEYAVCTVAGAGLGGLLIKLLTSDPMRELIWNVFQHAVSFLF